MSELFFGTAGVPDSAKSHSSVDGIKRVYELGLGCMELEFVRQAKMSEATARLVAETAASTGIKLSAHAPYYINLNAREPDKVQASQNRLLQTARIASWCGATSVAFHAAFYFDDPPEKVYSTVKKYLGEVLDQLQKENIQVWIRPEVMGKHSEFGTIEEILSLSTELERVAPCVDFAHWHARTGQYNSYQVHIHFSGIHYGAKGEIKHLSLQESDLQYTELLKALRDYEVKGLVICESPPEYMEEDALLLQSTYHTLLKAD